MQHPQKHVGTIRRVTWWGLAVNLALAAMKGATGLWAGSQALVADAVHSLSDCITDFAVIFGAPFWSKPPDAEHPYGHGRIETFITLAIALALAGVGVGIAYTALITLKEGNDARPEPVVLLAAILSIVVKEGLYRWTVLVGHRIKSTAIVANAWHHRTDALSSVPVVVTAAVTLLVPGWGFVDHVGAVIVSLFILQAAFQIGFPAVQQLVDRGATAKDRQRILDVARNTPGVRDVHALRTRYVGAGLVVDLHLLVDPELTVRQGHRISGVVKSNILEKIPEAMDVLIHTEPFEGP